MVLKVEIAEFAECCDMILFNGILTENVVTSSISLHHGGGRRPGLVSVGDTPQRPPPPPGFEG